MSTDDSNSTEGSPDNEIHLLAKLEEANRNLEADSKSVSSLFGQQPSQTSQPSHHSRQASISSQLSWNSLSAANQISPDSANNCPNIDETGSQEDIWLLWAQIIREWELYSKKKQYMKDLVRRGIPCHFRPIAWQLLANAHDPALRERYAEYLKRESPCEKAIRRDIARTYPHHEQFKDKDSVGQESLFNVMKAYSLHDREVGYCQGSGFIVGLLLMEMPEEDAFAVLVRLMQDYRLRELFKPSMAELGLCIYQLESLLQDHLLGLWKHFQAQGVHTTAYATGWFLTLFTTTFCTTVAARIMDLFISEGLDIIFRLAIAFLQNLETRLLNKDMEGILEIIQNTAPKEVDKDPDGLLARAFGLKINWKKMKKLEREYSANKSRELEEQIEMRRIRTENKLLLRRIDHLESENVMLADHLVQYQVSRAQEAEEMYALRRELATMKRKTSEAGISPQYNGDAGPTGDFKPPLQSEYQCKKTFGTSKTLDAVTSDLIQQLQTELVSVRYREAETNTRFREMQDRVRELEETNKQLAKNPTNEVAALQEELVAVKLREAESNLQLKEVQKRNSDLEAALRRAARASGGSGTQLANVMEERDLLGAEMRTVRSKLMEMESANQICTMQLARQDEELVNTKEKLQASLDRERELKVELSEVERRVADVEAKRKEEGMMWRIRETEQSSTIAELKQRIAELECQKQEIVCHSELRTAPSSSSPTPDQEKSSASEQLGHNQNKTPQHIPAALMTNSGIKRFWKDLPKSIMTESIGPLEDLCFVPDDPMITSIYIGDKKHAVGKPNVPPANSGGQ